MSNDMKVVIAGSAKLQDEIQKWIQYWNGKSDHIVLNYPHPIPGDDFYDLYPRVHKKFFADIERTDILFIANENKSNIDGYIGAEVFAELAYGVARKVIHNSNLKIILARWPSDQVACFDEIRLWSKLGWIDTVLDKNEQ